MRQKLIIAAILFSILFSLSCKKTSSVSTNFRAKVISATCGTFVLDVEGSNGIGTAYTNGSGTYSNAVVALDYCYLLDKNVKPGSIIDFIITATQTAIGSNCAYPLCLIREGPNKSIYVNDVVVVNP